MFKADGKKSVSGMGLTSTSGNKSEAVLIAAAGRTMWFDLKGGPKMSRVLVSLRQL